tara:strand:- start:82 stop:267 length:186 start_codon:yes stop_codon:yes gene_type:complete
MAGEGGGHAVCVVALMKCLVQQLVVEPAMNPVDTCVREHQEEEGADDKIRKTIVLGIYSFK